jgi:hypothetical protein
VGFTRQIQAANRTYLVVDDTTIECRAIVVGQVINEVTGAPLQGPFLVDADNTSLAVKTAGSGLYCLSGYPDRAFGDLGVAYTLNLAVTAPGYRDGTGSVVIPANATLPVSAPDVAVRRLPVRLQGRVTEETGSHAPIPGATIIAVDPPGTPPAEHVIVMRTPVHEQHPTVGVTVQGRNLVLAAPPGPTKQLATDAHREERTVTVNNRQGLAANQILRIGPEIWSEYAVIKQVSPTPPNLAQPGDVELHSPLTRSVVAGTAIDVFTSGAAVGLARQLVHATESGDGVLILDGIPSADVIEITDPVRPVEYHALGALTDADGYYHFNGIGRVGALHLMFSAPGFTPLLKPVSWVIDYQQPVNIVDSRLRPI